MTKTGFVFSLLILGTRIAASASNIAAQPVDFDAGINSVPTLIQEMKSPAASAAVPTQEARLVQLSPEEKAAASIAEEFELPLMNFSLREAATQACRGKEVCFEQALRAALKAFLNDSDHVDSPLSIIIQEVWTDEDGPAGPGDDWVPPTVMARAKLALRALMNRPSTTVRLLNQGEMPEGGESVKTNWIFALDFNDETSNLFDFGLWAVVDRSGKNQVYVYGFN